MKITQIILITLKGSPQFILYLQVYSLYQAFLLQICAIRLGRSDHQISPGLENGSEELADKVSCNQFLESEEIK